MGGRAGDCNDDVTGGWAGDCNEKCEEEDNGGRADDCIDVTAGDCFSFVG